MPIAPRPELSRLNPLSKVPVLELDDGTTLFDSPVICEYLDSLHEGRSFIPPKERYRILTVQALCDGILDAAVAVFQEKTMRSEPWEPWIAGHTVKVNQGLDVLERAVSSFGDDVDLGHICAGITLGWLDFRAPANDFRRERPRLATFYETFRARPSMRATEPKA